MANLRKQSLKSTPIQNHHQETTLLDDINPYFYNVRNQKSKNSLKDNNFGWVNSADFKKITLEFSREQLYLLPLNKAYLRRPNTLKSRKPKISSPLNSSMRGESINFSEREKKSSFKYDHNYSKQTSSDISTVNNLHTNMIEISSTRSTAKNMDQKITPNTNTNRNLIDERKDFCDKKVLSKPILLSSRTNILTQKKFMIFDSFVFPTQPNSLGIQEVSPLTATTMNPFNRSDMSLKCNYDTNSETQQILEEKIKKIKDQKI